jgi:hypothetical protein
MAKSDVTVPAVVAAKLVLVQAGFVLGGLEAFLDGPSGSGDAHELVDAGARRTEAQVVGQFIRVGDAAADQQPSVEGLSAADVVIGTRRQGGHGLVVQAGSFGSVTGRQALSCLLGGVRGEVIGA